MLFRFYHFRCLLTALTIFQRTLGKERAITTISKLIDKIQYVI
jgi:hypothetical protein